MEKINFFVPLTICKATTSFEEGGEMELEGIASTNDKDSDGEELDPSGYNLIPFLNNGIVNWNHRSKEDPSAVIGEPIEARITKDNELYVKVRLFKNSEKARQVYNLASVMENSSLSNKRLGFSIEGFPVLKDPFNKKKILKADITGLAITPTPKNKNTFASIIKGEYSEPFLEEEGLEDEGDLELEKVMTSSSLAPTTHESLEGVKIQKSFVYNSISRRLETNSPGILKSVYNFLEKNNMITTKEEIEKALDSLQGLLGLPENSETIEKGETQISGENVTTEVTTETVVPVEEIQKSKDTEDIKEEEKEGEIEKAAKSCYTEGMSKSQLAEELIRKGFDLDSSVSISTSIVAEMESKKQGGDITPANMGSVIQKAIEESLSGYKKESEKKLQQTIETFRKVTVGLSTELGFLKSENETLSKALKMPLGRKSIDPSTTSYKERFEEIQKSEEVTPLKGFNLSTKEGRESLCDGILDKKQESLVKGVPFDDELLKAIPSIEMSGVIPQRVSKKIELLFS